MTPERWRRVQELFLEAADLDPADHAALLDAECGGDAELRREVERMLAADAEAEPLLDDVPTVLAAAQAPAGRAVGPYRIVRELGRGGMGTVYLAERDDVGKRVALKLVRGALAAPEHGDRFLSERRILARLDHPNIAALHDAGVADDGTPYFAMEYVEGEPIDRYCDARRLPVRRRVELFLEVCAAVEFAHQRLVVHRDLKPSNVLVTAEGQVKLLDFGIAKVLEHEEPDGGQTGTGLRLMTPEYAAPEQVLGEPVTTATDVYALGVVLYGLLTGRLPYRLRRRTPGELEQAVLTQEAPRPSSVVRQAAEPQGDGTPAALPHDAPSIRATSTARLRRELAGDLDTVVLRALAKRPEHRYPSVQHFAGDLRRHLDGRPVTARPQTWRYRSASFVRRNRWGVAAGTAAALVLTGFSLVTAVQAREVARERDKAQEVAGFLTGLFSAASPEVARGETLTARQLLDEGAARIDRELADQPEVRAQMLDVVAVAYRGLGLLDAAGPPQDSALAIRRRLFRGDHPDVAESLHNLGWLLRDRGEHQEAELRFREALEMRHRLHGRLHPDVVRSANGVGMVLRDRGEFADAEATFRDALAVAQRVFAAPHLELSFAHSGLGMSLMGQGRGADAETQFREALRTLRAAAGDRHPDEAYNLLNLAIALKRQDRLDEAETVHREAVAAARRVGGPEHPSVAVHLRWLADVLTERGSLAEAETMYREALAIDRRSLPPGHARIGYTIRHLAPVLVQTGRAAEAEPLLREALEIHLQAFGPDHWQVATTRSVLGACLTALGRFAEAEALLRDAHDTLLRVRGPEEANTLRARRWLAELFEARGRPEEARRWREAPGGPEMGSRSESLP